jgi:hypothetical protein
MGLTDILFNAAGGGVVGSILHLGTSFFDTWQKKKQAEVEIMLMQAKVAAAEKEAAWNAFSKSQEGANQAGIPNLPESVSPWIANIYVCVDAFRAFTRPGLTWAGVFLLTIVFFKVSPVKQEAMVDEMQFAVWTAVFWWLGSRYNKSK